MSHPIEVVSYNPSWPQMIEEEAVLVKKTPLMTLALGLMSGTSMDGIDGALIETDGLFHVKQMGHVSIPYAPHVRTLLKAAESFVRQGQKPADFETIFQTFLQKSVGLSPEESEKRVQQTKTMLGTSTLTLKDVERLSTDLHREAVEALLRTYQATPDVIGYHGQTLYHNPLKRISLQMGDGQYLAMATGMKVVNNFRAKDMAAGGQGAPFAPLYHQALAMRDGKLPLAVVNCGGISNITLIKDDDPTSLISFDPGPGNSLIDQFVTLRTSGQWAMDMDGQFGAKGQVNESVLEELRQQAVRQNGENYLGMPPPKSLDIGDLHLLPSLENLSLEDGCATLEAFTAEAIVRSLDLTTPPYPKHWILAGGGWYNPVIKSALITLLQQRLGDDIVIETADEAGWNNRALEAQIFAYLAVRHLKGLPTSYPTMTGVSTPTVGGDVYG